MTVNGNENRKESNPALLIRPELRRQKDVTIIMVKSDANVRRSEVAATVSNFFFFALPSVTMTIKPETAFRNTRIEIISCIRKRTLAK